MRLCASGPWGNVGEKALGGKRGVEGMKENFTPWVVLIGFLFLMGMGELGGTAAVNKIPAPEKNFTVRVTDREGIQTSLSRFSQEGKVFLAAKHGSATITIPFEKISQIQFQGTEGNEVQVKVWLKGRESLNVRVDKRAKFYGQADFGTYQIEVKDLRSIRFLP